MTSTASAIGSSIASLPASIGKRVGGAVSSVAGAVGRLPGRITGRRGSGDGGDHSGDTIDEEWILRHSSEKLSVSLKTTPSKDAQTTAALAVKTGSLMKRNEQGQWRRVVVSIVPHWFLYYFDSELSDTPKGIIDLHSYTRMAIDANTLTINTSEMPDASPSPLRSYFFQDDDPRVLSEWVNALHQRYLVVREERDAYQQLQDQFTGEMASANSAMELSAQDRARMLGEIATARLQADDNLAAMQRVLVHLGITEEGMRALSGRPARAGEAVLAAIKESQEKHDRQLFELNEKRTSERQKLQDQVAALEKQLQAEQASRRQAEARALAEQREFELTVNREIRETLGRLDQATLNLQMAVASKIAAEERSAVLQEQKKVLVKEVKALRRRLEQSNETVDNLMALNDRLASSAASAVTCAGEGPAGEGSAHSGTIAALAAAAVPSAAAKASDYAPHAEGDAHDADMEAAWRDSSVSHTGSNDEANDDEEDRASWAMSANNLKELGWLSPEQRQLVESRSQHQQQQQQQHHQHHQHNGHGEAGSRDKASPASAATTSASSFSSSSPPLAASTPASSFFSTSTSIDKMASTSVTSMLGSLLGSSQDPSLASSSSLASDCKTPVTTVQAKAKVQSFFSSPLEDATPDRAPLSMRLQCLRCDGSVEGPKYSTCTCKVPALQAEDVDKEERREPGSSTSSVWGLLRRSSAAVMDSFKASQSPKEPGPPEAAPTSAATDAPRAVPVVASAAATSTSELAGGEGDREEDIAVL